jgi:translation initiation factor IF-3
MRIHYKRRKRPQFDPARHFRANEAIYAPEVRVIGEDGRDLGVMPVRRALEIARESELDLVEVAPKAAPPVCRVIDYGQFKYQKEKEQRARKTHARKVEVKGVRLSVKMGEHDLNIRRQKAKEFLEAGHKLKIEIILRGREKAHGDIAKQRIEAFIADLRAGRDDLFVEQHVKRQAGNFSAIVGRK